MRAVDIIIKKRNRQELSQAEIEFFVQGFTRGEIPDYQAAAWAMAVFLNGMTMREITDLTLAMAYSGEVLDLSDVVPFAVDKHSTGGVGDKTTLVVEPVVAACGLPVGKMSGRGLGFSGGTLDKLESIPGYRTNLSTAEFIRQLRQDGLVLTGQTADLAPADGRLYTLRDVSGTVESVPLVASSVMCKKIAAGAQAIVLDVKLGYGAFVPDLEQARGLAEAMVAIGKLTGRKTIALLSDMNQPLGFAVGNALEVKEAIATLHGGGPEDFLEHCLVVAGHMLALSGQVEHPEAGKQLASQALLDGRAWEKFCLLVRAQGGRVEYVEQPERLPTAPLVKEVASPASGYISRIHARLVGEAAVLLGAGRAKKGDPIDPAVGVEIRHKVGDYVAAGEPLFTIHASDADKMAEGIRQILDTFAWSAEPLPPLPLFYGVVEA